MNNYCSLTEFKNRLGITATTDDVAIIKTIEGASRFTDKYCNRIFYLETRTKYFHGAGRLWPPDLMTVSTFKLDEDANASFEATLTASDYNLLPFNDYPKTRIEIADTSDYGAFATGVKKGVEIVGEWGYGDGTSSPLVSDTILAASVSTGAIASVSSATNLSVGMTIKLGDEQAYISSVSGTTLGLERGINGTTAAIHANATQLYYYDYPADIKEACLQMSARLWETGDKQLAAESIGDYSYTMGKLSSSGLTEREQGLLFPYRKMRF